MRATKVAVSSCYSKGEAAYLDLEVDQQSKIQTVNNEAIYVQPGDNSLGIIAAADGYLRHTDSLTIGHHTGCGLALPSGDNRIVHEAKGDNQWHFKFAVRLLPTSNVTLFMEKVTAETESKEHSGIVADHQVEVDKVYAQVNLWSGGSLVSTDVDRFDHSDWKVVMLQINKHPFGEEINLEVVRGAIKDVLSDF